MQALNSLTTVVQMGIFAVLLPRAAFDDYAVWITSTMFAIGLGQAVGSERVVIGRRSFADGMSSAWSLGIAIFVVQAGVAVWLQSPELAVCALGVLFWAVWDFLRIVQGFDRAGLFLSRDLGVVLIQVGSVVAAWALGLPDHLLVVVWWGVGTVLWPVFIIQLGLATAAARRGGFRVLWHDRRESAPLLLDAALAGVPLVLALALARSQGSEGDASAARMALTILGPVTVLGIAGRRIVYSARAAGGFSVRARAMFTAAVVVVFVVCFAILVVTRTPLYPLLLPGFAGLSWWAILGFSTNHASVMAAMLPAANLRADRRSLDVGAARILSTVAAVVFVWLYAPFDTVAHVAWCVAASSIVYAVVLYAVSLVRPPRIVAEPVEQGV